MELKLQAALQLTALPVRVSTVQLMPSSQPVGQLAGGSHISPDSTTALPQLAEQSSSVTASQPAGQQPSPSAQETMEVKLQAALQLTALPVKVSTVQSLPSSQPVGQLAGGSHVSPGSTTSLPQLAEQSSSSLAWQAAGQQPSPSVQLTTGSLVHETSQVDGAPDIESVVQSLPSEQLPGQLAAGSQVSPASTSLLPQIGAQSSSLLAWQPDAQQPSPSEQLTMGLLVHTTSHVEGPPDVESAVQSSLSSQLEGQLAGGSQVSPASTMSLPQTACPGQPVPGTGRFELQSVPQLIRNEPVSGYATIWPPESSYMK